MKKLIKPIMLLLALGTFFFSGCSNGSSDPSYTSPDVWGVLNGSSLKGSYAVAGSSFDGATAVIIGSASGSRQNVSMTSDTLPAGVKTVFIDWPSLQTIGNDTGGTLSFSIKDLDRLYYWTQQGATLVFHKPESYSVITILLHIQDRLNFKSLINNNSMQSAFTQKQSSTNVGEFGELDWDMVAIKPDASAYYLNRMDNSGKTYTIKKVTESSKDEEPATTTESTETVTATSPTTDTYALFAAEAVKWLNETKEQALQRYTQAAGSDSDLMNQVCSSTVTIYSQCWNPENQKETINLPLTLRVWTSCMYNFSKDEDFYHVLLEEEFDPSPIYKGEYNTSKLNFGDKERWSGHTWESMNLQICWPFTYYSVRDLWNIQPEGNAAPVTTELISGWSVNADISGSEKGVAGKLSGSYKSEEHVKTVENDVSVTYKQNVGNEKWLQWFYTFGQQVYYTGKLGSYKFHEPSSNATSRSRSRQRQSWNWVISNTKQRGSEPFYFSFNLTEMKHHWSHLFTSIWPPETSTWTSSMPLTISNPTHNIYLPVPERYKHTYSLTTDEIGDITEFNNLMTALSNVSSNFDQLRAKLIRKDSSGNICGRTGVTEDALQNMVGQEWYNLAMELVGKKIAVNKTYKFYVKDENGNKLPMIYNKLTIDTFKAPESKFNISLFSLLNKWIFGHNDIALQIERYDAVKVGTYLVISPEGISITDN